MTKLKHRRYQPSLGSISHGTLRTEDLLEAFLDELCRVAPRKHGKLKQEARAALRREGEGEWDSEIVDNLADALNEHAPCFTYFGNSEGDGADFGWWPSWEAIEELDQFEGTDKAAEARHVGEFKVISDHGNIELYCRFGNGRIKNYFGIV